MYSKPERFSTCWRGFGPAAGNDQLRGFQWTGTDCEAAPRPAAKEKTGERGFDPRLTDSESVSQKSQPIEHKQLTETESSDLLRNLLLYLHEQTELQTILEAWPSLSTELRRALVRLVKVDAET